MFKDINSAFLAKLGWKIVVGDESLWCRMLRVKYLRGKSFFEARITAGASPGWSSILRSKHFIMKGACFKIGNGLKANPWKKPLLINLRGKIPSIKENVDVSQWTKVIDLRLEYGSDWNRSLIHNICNEESAEAILQLSWHESTSEDRMIWCGNRSRVFTITNCFAINCFADQLVL